jgi:transcriptional regulator with XRE-family HTH domain
METYVAKSIGRAKFVRKEREKWAWSQSQLAEVAGVSLRTVQRLEKDGIASFETLMAIAQAFRMDVKDLDAPSKTPGNGDLPKKVYLLPRLTSGKDLAGVIGGADQFQVEHDEADDKRAVGAMRSVLEALKGDVVRWTDADPMGKFNIEIELSEEIKGLEKYGFYLFGVKRTIPQVVGEERTLISMSTLYMSHSRSPKIIRDKKFNMAIPAVLPEVAS